VEDTIMKRALAAAGLLLGLALLASPARAQTGTARGKVLDVDGKPIAEATVVIEFQGGINRKFETRSNKKGEWMQVGMQPGPYRFTASKEGYQSGIADHFRISLGDATNVPDFKLQTAKQAANAPGGEADQLRKAFSAAVELQSAGKLDEAIAAYKALLEANPEVPEAYLNLGSMYATKKDNAAAEAAFQKALELRPGFTDAATSLARLYQATGQGDKALAVMDQAAAANPSDAKSQYSRGLVLMQGGKTEDAVKAFEAASTADPTLADAFYWLGSQLLNLGRTDDAAAAYEKYLALNPGNAQQVAAAQGILAALKKKK
jgi:tetratricopeptide (TPR) repeat protein